MWNCRDAAGKCFADSMRNMCMDFKTDLVVLLEPRAGGSRGRRIIKCLGDVERGGVEDEGVGEA